MQFCSSFNRNDGTTCPRSPTEQNILEPESTGVDQEAATVIGNKNAYHREDRRWDQNSSQAMLAMNASDQDNNDTTIWFLLRVATYYWNSFPLSFGPRKMWYPPSLLKATQPSSPTPTRQGVLPRLTQCQNLHCGAGILTSLLQARNGFDKHKVLLSGEVHKTVPLSQASRHGPVAGCSPLYTSTENHCCCRTKNLPLNFHHTGLDRTGRYDIQIKVDDNFTQSNSFKKRKKKKRSSNDWVLLLGWVQVVTYQCQATRVEKLTGRSKCLIKPTWFDREEQSQSWIDSCRLMLKSVLWLWLPLAVLPLLTMSTYSIWLPFRLQLFKSSILPMLFS